jgi:DeoR/GlpR family transcriptional regulator of sugar metabolism
LPVREKENAELKHEIGEIVSSFIKEGQSIALDASTTNHEVIKVLKTKFKKLTILTNYLPIINELQDMEKYTVIITGGILHNEEQSIVGGLSEESIGKLHVDIALISITGISLHNGMTDYGFDEVRVKKKMMSKK